MADALMNEDEILTLAKYADLTAGPSVTIDKQVFQRLLATATYIAGAQTVALPVSSFAGEGEPVRARDARVRAQPNRQMEGAGRRDV